MTYQMIDGSQGEGGGQVLRSALTLAMLSGQSIEITNIRRGRKKSGLLRQHLTSLRAAAKICNARVEGDELGSTHIRFAPGAVQSGDYHFVIGTAGSTVLVCQTILPALLLANGESVITFEGGTHNGMSPSLSFLQDAYLPILKMMGATCDTDVMSLGFYPAGGGKWQLKVKPVETLQPFNLSLNGESADDLLNQCSLRAMHSALPRGIAEREVNTAKKHLEKDDLEADIQWIDSPGPGNSFQVLLDSGSFTNVFEVTGEYGVSAENVAKRAVGRVKKLIYAGAVVEEHLADQLLLLMVIAGAGSFTTTQPSSHTLTNIAVIEQLMPLRFGLDQSSDKLWRIFIKE